MASVGVCTRPTVVRWKPPLLELNAVIARVPLMPTSQSASERHTAASASGSISLVLAQTARSLRGSHAGVIDCSHSRLIGLLGLRMLHDVAEDQLAFAPGVAGIDERRRRPCA